MNIENKKQIATILLAVGLGLVAAFLTSQYVKTSIEEQTRALARDFEKQNAQQKAALVKELQARDREITKKLQDLEKRQQQQLKQIKFRAPRGRASAGGASQVIDSTVFATITPPGKRALTIMIDSLSAVGGLINPGDFVDVLAHLNIPGPDHDKEDSKKVTSIIFQNIQVLAVGANFRPEGSSLIYQQQQQARSLNVTLAVAPDEAGLMTFAQANGKLQLVLRSPVEKDTKILEVASWNTLSDYVFERQGTEIDIPEPKPKIKASSKDKTTEIEPFIEIFRGGREL